MPSVTTPYNPLHKYLLDGTVDLDTDPIKVALVTSAYAFDAAHTDWGQISAYEVANGAGYTTGGIALVNPAASFVGNAGKFIADNPVWAGLTKTFRRAVLYVDATKNSIVKPLIACVLLDNTPADVVVSGADYSIQWNAAGILTLSS